MKICKTCKVELHDYEFDKTPSGNLKATCILCRNLGKSNYRKRVRRSYYKIKDIRTSK